MGVSLLYRDEKAWAQTGRVSQDAFDRLALSKMFDWLMLPRQDADCFWEVMAKPLTAYVDVVYRRELLECFRQTPALLNGLSDYLERLQQLKSDHHELKKERRQILRASSKHVSPDAAKNMLRSSALTLKRCLLILQAIENPLRAHGTQAEGLGALLEALQAITRKDAFDGMMAFCSRLEMYSENSGSAVGLGLNALGTLTSFALLDRQSIFFQKPSEKKKSRFLFKKETVEFPPAAPIDLNFSPLCGELRVSAMISLTDCLDAITEQLFATFLPINRELTFYRCALRTVQRLEEKGAPLCYAEGTTDEPLSFHELYDPLLVLSCEKIEKIVPNDLPASSASGIIILGANGSGKTVWLRSVGLMQLFSQAGLPIPAKNAKILLYKRIFTHFSAGEEEFEPESEAGRFEQEVRRMAAILDEIDDCGGLILLNEIFQTTAYGEGAEGLSHILRYLSEGGNHWILTTHLLELPQFLSEGECALYRTDGSYRVHPAKL